jgi:hypothetical protein
LVKFVICSPDVVSYFLCFVATVADPVGAEPVIHGRDLQRF